MGYGRRWRSTYRRRIYRSTYWKAAQDRERADVSQQFSGIDADVKNEFFSLPWSKLERVFRIYGDQYGDGAERYARTAYEKWRTGAVAPSGQTLTRLLNVVPEVIDFPTKLALYRRLRNAHRQHERLTVTLTGATDLALVEDAARRIVERARAQPLPFAVENCLTWLSQGDGLVARQLVSEAEVHEGEAVAGALRRELTTLRDMLERSLVPVDASHFVQLPCGLITVAFAKPKQQTKRWWWQMANSSESDQPKENAQLPVRRQDALAPRSARDIIDLAMQHAGSQEIVTAAQQEALRLEVKRREGVLDSETAKREMDEFLKQAEEASSLQGMEYEADAHFKRASGRTHMTVKKQRRWWWPF
ncbi:MAG: hypothetical protein HY332_19470 [Chloroflexi bacterium]|nr:hypothetical protein [Chloroflexota bacterium]